MPSKEEKARRKSLVNIITDEASQEFLNSMPISIDVVKELFDFLDEELETRSCDDTNIMTIEFLENKNLDKEKIIPWLNDLGGYCDCEILGNVEEAVMIEIGEW